MHCDLLMERPSLHRFISGIKVTAREKMKSPDTLDECNQMGTLDTSAHLLAPNESNERGCVLRQEECKKARRFNTNVIKSTDHFQARWDRVQEKKTQQK